jgi:hypothetical protein
MILKIKAFIFRFSNIFNISIYLAKKEERAFLESIEFDDELDKSISIGLWQATHGFTTIWTYKKPFHKALISKIKHAFDFRDYND